MSTTDELPGTGYPNSLQPELHKALKARGIDYWVAQGITFWNRDDGCECLVYGYEANGVPKLAVKVVGFTDPEQAIAATVGVDSNTEEAIRKLLDKLNTELCNAGCVIECETREERRRLIDAVKDKYAQVIATTVVNVGYGIQFADWCEFPPETMVGETVYDGEGNAIGWITNATAGREALTAEQVRECAREVYFEGYSDGATHRAHGIEDTDWQTIADKLNATLGAGTCYPVPIYSFNGEFTEYDCDACSECGTEWDGDMLNFCPNCGRRVMEADE